MDARTMGGATDMNWFAIEIGVALAPLALLLWWTVRLLRKQRTPDDGARPDETDVP